ncbi:Uncharacterised protein [Candidatus Norongarragalina meridionalis]|nr:Uncharacterised protein [Candidatus Norongarragalina meridionalis]
MDIKLIIQKMRERGMSDDEIRKNLKELGVAGADEAMGAKPGDDRSPGFSMTSVGAEGDEKEISVASMIQKSNDGTPLFQSSSSVSPKLEQKLDDAIALLRALQDIEKKVLQTNQEILLRLKK